MISTLEQRQVPNGTGPAVRRSKRPLLASRTRCNVIWKPKKIGNEVDIAAPFLTVTLPYRIFQTFQYYTRIDQFVAYVQWKFRTGVPANTGGFIFPDTQFPISPRPAMVLCKTKEILKRSYNNYIRLKRFGYMFLLKQCPMRSS